MLKRFFILLMLGASLIAAPFFAQAAVHCDFDNTSMVTTLFDFSEMPNGINASAPVGTVLFNKTHQIPVWCAKDGRKGSSISGPEPIYINRSDVSNVFGSKSGLTLYITVAGDRGNTRKAFNTGLQTSYLWLPSLSTKDATRFTLDVTIELVKTAENTLLSAKNTVMLFGVGDQFDTSDMVFYMKNGGKLVFTTQTCDVMGSGNYTANLPPLNISDVKGTGPVDGHTADINVQLSCNSTLWSSQSIMMKLTGQDVPGSASDGLFFFKSLESGESAMGIALQIFQGARGQAFTPVTVGQNVEVGNFEDGQSVVTIPLRAGYYVRDKNMTPGKLQSILVYQIDYQ